MGTLANARFTHNFNCYNGTLWESYFEINIHSYCPSLTQRILTDTFLVDSLEPTLITSPCPQNPTVLC